MGRALLVLWGGIVALACSPAPDDPDDDDRPSCDPSAEPPATAPVFEVLGETSVGHYELVEANAELLRHSGPQGGQHFWIRVRVFSNEEQSFGFSAKLVDVAGETRATGNRGFTACAGSWSKEREITVFLDPAYEPVTGTLEVRVPSEPSLAAFEAPVSVP